MPLNKDQLLRYQVLNACFKDTSRLYDIGALVECCQQETVRVYGKSVSKRSVQNDIHLLQYEPYNVEFDEELRKSGHYRYADTTFNLEVVQNLSPKERTALHDTIELLRPMCQDAETATPLMQWMLVSLQRLEAGKVLAENAPCVEFENNALLAGMGNFNFLLECILNHQPVTLRYQSFKRNEAQDINVHPYYLKQFNGRWYFLATADGYDTVAAYALDRILTVGVWKAKYRPASVDIAGLYADTIGVTISSDSKAERVVLKVAAKRYPYIETKPFSEKQKIVKKDEETITITFPMRINKELVAELLSFGVDIEVLEPMELRKEMTRQIASLNEKYSAVQKDCTQNE